MASATSSTSRPPPPPYSEAPQRPPPPTIKVGDDVLFEVSELTPAITGYKLSFTAREERIPFLTRFYPFPIQPPYSNSFSIRSALDEHCKRMSSEPTVRVISIQQSFFDSQREEHALGTPCKLLFTALKPMDISGKSPTHLHVDVCPESIETGKRFSLRYSSITKSRPLPHITHYTIRVKESLSSKPMKVTVLGGETEQSFSLALNEENQTAGSIKTAAKVLTFTFELFDPPKKETREVNLSSLKPGHTPTFTLKRDKEKKHLQIKYRELVAPASASSPKSPSSRGKKKQKDSASVKS